MHLLKIGAYSFISGIFFLVPGCQQDVGDEQNADIVARGNDPIERMVTFSVAVSSLSEAEDTATVKTVTTSVNGTATEVPCTMSAATKLVDAIKLRECSYYIAGSNVGTLINPTCFKARSCPTGISASADETFRITASGQGAQRFGGEFEAQGKLAITFNVGGGAPEGAKTSECSPVNKAASDRLLGKLTAQIERACGGSLAP
jgi:hypothetical protein